MFAGGIEVEHWLKMGQNQQKTFGYLMISGEIEAS